MLNLSDILGSEEIDSRFNTKIDEDASIFNYSLNLFSESTKEFITALNEGMFSDKEIFSSDFITNTAFGKFYSMIDKMDKRGSDTIKSIMNHKDIITKYESDLNSYKGTTNFEEGYYKYTYSLSVMDFKSLKTIFLEDYVKLYEKIIKIVSESSDNDSCTKKIQKIYDDITKNALSEDYYNDARGKILGKSKVSADEFDLLLSSAMRCGMDTPTYTIIKLPQVKESYKNYTNGLDILENFNNIKNTLKKECNDTKSAVADFNGLASKLDKEFDFKNRFLINGITKAQATITYKTLLLYSTAYSKYIQGCISGLIQDKKILYTVLKDILNNGGTDNE